MNDKIRKTVPLVGALALASSVVLGGSGAALAGKPAPHIPDGSDACDPSPRVWWLLSAAKGKWLHVRTEYRVAGSNDWQDLMAEQPARVPATVLEIDVPAGTVEARVLATNRKGASLSDPEQWSSAVVDC